MRISLLLLGLLALAAGIVLVARHRPPPTPLAVPVTSVESAAPADVSAPLPAAQGPRASLVSPPADSDPAVAALIARLLDDQAPLKSRREAAIALARKGSPAAIAALKAALRSGPPFLKAAIGESLGQSPHPEALGLMLELAHGGDEVAARGAMRGLASRGDEAAAQTLADTLWDANRPLSVRTEAALALGDVHRPEALQTLVRAARDLPDNDVVAYVLEGLGRRPFSETTEFFSAYLGMSNLGSELRVAAVESLETAGAEAVPLLLQCAGDPDAEVREAAAWALVNGDPQPEIAPRLIELLKQESSPEVRRRFYQALAGQETSDLATALTLATRETDLDARLAGFGLWAATCRKSGSPDTAGAFAQDIVPELARIACGDAPQQSRVSAVHVLHRAGTPEALAALSQIAQQSSDPRVTEAARTATGLTPKGK